MFVSLLRDYEIALFQVYSFIVLLDCVQQFFLFCLQLKLSNFRCWFDEVMIG